jgi:hypothetical protein
MKFCVAVKANHTNFHIDELLYKRGQSGVALLTNRIEGRGRDNQKELPNKKNMALVSKIYFSKFTTVPLSNTDHWFALLSSHYNK